MGPSTANEDNRRVTEGQGTARQATCQFSVYPLGEAGYMKTIYDVVGLAKANGIYAGSPHFCTRLEGRIDTLFDTLEESFRTASSQAGHTVMTATVSCNSPSKGDG